ncbi:uncharacterized protein TrAtP1_011247 [Trichoderma atroviride]|uniref:uncharacterized protein n=1 Tax=Hypocrea atroviridis TaxID=63577 RepID=UPI003324FA85|nr:hypothetical protein TrAtP1_011247 [Trichoderma atroviride]
MFQQGAERSGMRVWSVIISIGIIPAAGIPAFSFECKMRLCAWKPKLNWCKAQGVLVRAHSSKAISTIRQATSMVEQRRSSRFSRAKDHLFGSVATVDKGAQPKVCVLDG